MTLLTLREHDPFAIADAFCTEGRKAVTPVQAETLERLSDRLRAGGMKGGFITHANRTTLKARQFVGVVQLGAEAIEIIPKIDGLDERDTRIHLFRMLARAGWMALHELEAARLAEQHRDILEIFIRLFCDKLFAELHRGLIGAYRRESGDLPALRGKLLTGLQATLNAFHPERFQCEYDEFSLDTPLNRVLKSAVVKLRRVTREAENARRLAELEFALEEVTSVSAASLKWHRLHFDRSNRRYEALANMARRILERRTQDVTAGESDGFSLLFDMNELFEAYIGAMARSVFAPDWQVVLQGPAAWLLEDEAGLGRSQIRPDITGLEQGRPRWIIDTKWKRLDAADAKQGVAQADIYQMLGYAHRLDVERIVLLYPQQRGEASVARCFRILEEAPQRPARELWVARIDLSDLDTVPEQLQALPLPRSGREGTDVFTGFLAQR